MGALTHEVPVLPVGPPDAIQEPSRFESEVPAEAWRQGDDHAKTTSKPGIGLAADWVATTAPPRITGTKEQIALLDTSAAGEDGAAGMISEETRISYQKQGQSWLRRGRCIQHDAD